MRRTYSDPHCTCTTYKTWGVVILIMSSVSRSLHKHNHSKRVPREFWFPFGDLSFPHGYLSISTLANISSSSLQILIFLWFWRKHKIRDSSRLYSGNLFSSVLRQETVVFLHWYQGPVHSPFGFVLRNSSRMDKEKKKQKASKQNKKIDRLDALFSSKKKEKKKESIWLMCDEILCSRG